jgi:hypothetical protein
LPKVFALGSSFLQRLDSRHHHHASDDGTTSAASLDGNACLPACLLCLLATTCSSIAY